MKKLIAMLLAVIMTVSSLSIAVFAVDDTEPTVDDSNVIATLFDSGVTDYSAWSGNSGYSYELTTVDGITVLQHCTWSSGSVTFKRSFDVDWSEHDYANIKIVAYVYIDIDGEESDDIYSDELVSKGKFEIRESDSANRYVADLTDGLVLHTGWNAIELTLDDMPIQKAADGATQETGYTTTSEFCFYLTCNGHELTMSLASAYIIDTEYDNTETEADDSTAEEETTEATEETTESETTSGTETGTADDVTITSFAKGSTGTLEFSNDFSLTYTFTNTSTGSNNWDNFIVEVFNSDGVYITVRADNYGWLANQTDTADTLTFGDGLDEDGWTAWREAMAAGSECTVTVVREGTTVTITSVCGGATFTATAVVSEFADADLTVHLTGENVNLTSVAYSYIIDTETTEEIPYTDVSSTQWFYESVVWAYESGLMVGKTDDTFAPDDTMTRAEFVTVLYRLENGESEYTAENANPFTDVSSAQWFYKYVMWAYDNKIINGTSDTTFDPDGSITREQIALILYRRYGEETECDLSVYPDADEISTYSDEPAAAMQWAVSVGLIKGNEDGTLDPQGNATRAQVATIYMRYVGE